MVGYIYLVTNKVSGKQYVGKTIKTVENRWSRHLVEAKRGSRYAFHRAIRKYGQDAFEVRTIATVNAEELSHVLDDVEKFCIRFYGTLSNGYNMTEGGEGSPLTSESCEKISKSLRRYFEDPSVREKNRQATIRYFENPEARKKASQAAVRRFENSAERDPTEREKKRKADYIAVVTYAQAHITMTQSGIARHFNLSRTVRRILTQAVPSEAVGSTPAST